MTSANNIEFSDPYPKLGSRAEIEAAHAGDLLGAAAARTALSEDAFAGKPQGARGSETSEKALDMKTTESSGSAAERRGVTNSTLSESADKHAPSSDLGLKNPNKHIKGELDGLAKQPGPKRDPHDRVVRPHRH